MSHVGLKTRIANIVDLKIYDTLKPPQTDTSLVFMPDGDREQIDHPTALGDRQGRLLATFRPDVTIYMA